MTARLYDCSERRRLRRDKHVQVRPHRALSERGGSRTARGKRPPENGNQLISST